MRMTQERARETLEDTLSPGQQARIAALAAARRVVYPSGLGSAMTSGKSLDIPQTANMIAVAEWILDGTEPELPFEVTIERHQFKSMKELREFLRRNAGPDCGNPDCPVHQLTRYDTLRGTIDRPLTEEEQEKWREFVESVHFGIHADETEDVDDAEGSPEPPPPLLDPEYTHKVKIGDDIYPVKVIGNDDDSETWYESQAGVRYRRIEFTDNDEAIELLHWNGTVIGWVASVEPEPDQSHAETYGDVDDGDVVNRTPGFPPTNQPLPGGMMNSGPMIWPPLDDPERNDNGD